jgi:3-hydroxybutyrate dehydrogenase
VAEDSVIKNKVPRVALIAGASSGIGKACAEILHQKGVRVAIADINLKGQDVANTLNGIFIQADLSKREDCQKLVNQTVLQLGALDILVNNAGFQSIHPIAEFPEDTWDKMIALMLTAPFLLTKYAWEHLKKSGQGRIIHMGSAHSLTASPYKAAYVSAKHALLGLMRVSALEGGEHGITCNTVAPAYVRTALVEAQIADQAKTRGISESEVESKVFLENVAVKKLLEPTDVANYVAFLASEEAWGITGSTATIDLGWTAR